MEPSGAGPLGSHERLLQRLSGPTFVVGLAVLVIGAALSFFDPLPQRDIQTTGDRVTWVLPAGASWDRGVRVGDNLPLERNGDRGEQRDGSVVGTPPEAPLSKWVNIAVITVAAVYVGTGLETFRRARRKKLVLGFAAFTVSTGYALLALRLGTAGVPAAAFVFQSLVTLAVALLPLMAIQTVKLEPGTTRIARSVGLLVLLEYVIVQSSYALTFIGFPNAYDFLRVWLLGRAVAYMVVGTGVVVWSYRADRSLISVDALRLILIAIVGGLGPFVLVVVLWPAVRADAFVDAAYASIVFLSAALIPVAFAYTMLRHQIMEVSGFYRRSVVRAAVAAFLFFGFVAIAFAARGLLRSGLVGNETLSPWLVVIFIALGVLLVPLFNIASNALDQFVYADSFDLDDAISRLAHGMAGAAGLDALTTAVNERLRTVLNTAISRVWVPNTGGGWRCYPGGDRTQVAAADATEHQELDHSRRQALRLRGHLLISLEYQHRVIGWLDLGPKQNGEPFGAKDLRLVEAVRGPLSVGIENGLLLDELRMRVNELEKSNQDMEEARRDLRLLNTRLVSAEEMERKRIAREIHDSPLARAMMLQRRLADSVAGIVGADFDQMTREAEEIAAELRSVCSALRPPQLDDLGLAAALEWLCSDYSRRGGIPITFANMSDGMRMDPEMETALFRVAQEALNNALRHADASRLEVVLEGEARGCRLVISDDGRGMPGTRSADILVQRGHLGIAGMRERLAPLGGGLHLSESAYGGVRVIAEIPTSRLGGDENG